MTITVYLHTRKPESEEAIDELATLTRVPVVGEYISFSSTNEYYYKVLLVVHNLDYEGRQLPEAYDAEVYALGSEPNEAHKASGFFPTTVI